MTDYLELVSAEHERALLELERRLEWALSGLAQAGGAEESPSAGEESEGPAADGEPAERRARPLEERPDADGAPLSEETEGQEEQRKKRLERRTRSAAENRPAALLAELEQLERAAGYLSEQGAASSAAGQPDGPASIGAGRRWPVSLAAADAYAYAGGEALGMGGSAPWRGGRGETTEISSPDWTERTDRAFRRDSRRYDGGFYLY